MGCTRLEALRDSLQEQRPGRKVSVPSHGAPALLIDDPQDSVERGQWPVHAFESVPGLAGLRTQGFSHSLNHGHHSTWFNVALGGERSPLVRPHVAWVSDATDSKRQLVSQILDGASRNQVIEGRQANRSVEPVQQRQVLGMTIRVACQHHYCPVR